MSEYCIRYHVYNKKTNEIYLDVYNQKYVCTNYIESQNPVEAIRELNRLYILSEGQLKPIKILSIKKYNDYDNNSQ